MDLRPRRTETIQHNVDCLWSSREESQDVMDELSSYYLEQKDGENQNAVTKESNELELECQQAIERSQAILISGCFRDINDGDNVEVGNTIGSNAGSMTGTTPKDRHHPLQLVIQKKITNTKCN